ncbi:SDR family NAD(P)-dependent oxidoreductase [Herbaspirillum sp. SJZ099]|uniref:SDR family NAD(P)-dependent oxidoreductase n=1 Tax=Herbaspirillum sp. SJZ099 TaxID=2572916 RepID=UPI00119E9603|nr:SDR family NAD(P)-dependent oxidoreductase [Herbaspirillum sp. SJZ099]TWC67294.1 short-subunit dehydrogenase [Herbaspirillum sp. SJZ099]
MKAIITGHSRGLGQALAHELLARGVDVLGLARGAAASAQCGARLRQISIDLSDTGALAAVLQTPLLAEFADAAQPVLLINNAACAGPLGYAGTLGARQVAQALALNVQAPLMLAERVLALAAHERRIMHISSGVGTDAYAALSVYCASKAALDQHARALWQESRGPRPGLRVASVSPGVIDTDMQSQLRHADGAAFPLRGEFDQLHRSGQLQSPRACARRLVELMLDQHYGRQPVMALPPLMEPDRPG